jgi:hypothetical protein
MEDDIALERLQFWINPTMQKLAPHDEANGMPLWIQSASIN